LRKDPLAGSYTEVGSEVTLADHGIPSIAFFTDRGWNRSTHPALGVETLNIDLRNGSEFGLPSIFRERPGYLEFIAAEASGQVPPR
jgi:hypothetical protein